MAAVFRVLGQVFPAANVESILYTCGANSAIISSFIVSNSANVADAISARICVGGAPDDPKQILYSSMYLAPLGVLELTAGLTFSNADVVKITSANGTSTFQLFGQENS